MELPLLCPFVNCVLVLAKFPIYFPYFVCLWLNFTTSHMFLCLASDPCIAGRMESRA
ncbi:hypothetical protein COLO4_37927 [Corchorus olitorius]|uniref:Uncharacterized protein n=1 Tax=Corchorus olitorius TaxID=93759 RepID=A0A1R3FXW3_9ROSI|nr:hypothetical protein COLO4_37927 [Corchorus olitorius]